MFRSLRLRLQMWHALILTAVVVLFGAAFYRQLYRSTIGEIDAELLSGARILEGTLRALPSGMARSMLQEMPLDLPRSVDRRPPRPRDLNSPDAPPPHPFDAHPPGPPLTQPTEPEPKNELEPETASERSPGNRPKQPESRRPLFDGRPGMHTPPLYFAIFDQGGSLLRSEGNSNVSWTAPRRPLEFRNKDLSREVLLRGPRETLIIVGRDVGPERRRLTEAFIQLVLIGVSVLGLGLIGGWWLAGNAIRPIKAISSTAEEMTAQNLAGRIDTNRMDVEFESLGTSLNAMFQRLADSFDQQSQFTADASHELRTPIAVLISHCELALSRARSDEEYRKTIATCLNAAGRMKELVDGLLTLARADAGQLELRRTPIDLRDLAVEAVEMLRPYALERQIEISQEGDSAPCVADASRIAQVIANLVHNAILYNRSGGSVLLQTSVVDGFAVLKVEDTGDGIPAEAIPHLFDRFFRVAESRTRTTDSGRTSGSGLGLSICKSIVDAHGGTITFQNRAAGGSLFEVQLPIR